MPHALADLVATRRDALVAQGEGCVRETLGPAAERLSRQAVLAPLGALLAALERTLRGSKNGAEAAARALVAERLAQGVEPAGALAELGVVRGWVLEVAEQAGAAPTIAELRALEAALGAGALAAVRGREEDDARLRTLLEHAPCVVFAKDAEGRYVFVSREFERALGLEQARVLGRTDADLFPPELARAYREHDLAVLGSGEPQEWEERARLADGRERTFLSLKFVLKPPEGGPPAVCGIANDVTEHRQAEAALRESEERFRALVEGVQDYAVFMMDAQGRVVSWNPGVERIKGYTAQELLGQSYACFFTPEDRAAGVPERILAEAARTGRYRGEGVRVRKDGTRFRASVALTALRDEAGRLKGFAKVTRDITHEREADDVRALFVDAGRLLTESLELKPTLGTLARLAVGRLCDWCMVDLVGEDGQLHRVEVAARDPRDEALARRTLAYPPLLVPGNPLTRAFEGGEPMVVPRITPAWLDAAARDAEHRRILEQLAPGSCVVVPLMARGQRLGLINLAWRQPDAPTEQRVALARALVDRAAVALLNARLYGEAQEAARVREEVVAVLSHDLRNPLNAILLSVRSLHGGGALEPRVARTLERIEAAATRGTRLIHDLLDFTHARRGPLPLELQRFDLAALARAVVDEVQTAHPERALEATLPVRCPVEADPDRLAQALANLVSNAVQYSRENTTVRVSCTVGPEGPHLAVHNEGAPIPPERQARMFEPFERGTREQRSNLGLGLYIAREVVRAHGGRLDVHSTAESGTTFTVRLPLQSLWPVEPLGVAQL